MTKLEQAARQALEALETLDCGDSYKTHNAAASLREALMESNISDHKLAEQAEQEPVAWLVQYKDCHTFVWGRKPEFIVDGVVEPLYAAHVRTKDLTDDEIADIRMSIVAYEPVEWGRVFARAVISADRSKNNV